MMQVRIPPGGRVTLEIDALTGRVIQDPIGGRPVQVSDRLVPDPMAIYLLGTAIIDATRAIDGHTAAIERHTAAEAGYRRWQRISTIALCCLASFSLLSLVILAWTHLRWQ